MSKSSQRKEILNQSNIETGHASLDTSRTLAKELFTCRSRPWEALYSLHEFIRNTGPSLPFDQYDEVSENVWVHVSAYLAPTAKLHAPAIICGGARISHASLVAGSIVGAFSTVGEFTSLKNSITFDRARIFGHNDVSFSIMGYNCCIGSGSILPSTRLDGANILFDMPEGVYISGKTTLGSVICDGARIGALCVINPGSVIDSDAVIPPMSSISGYVYPFTNAKR